MRIAILFLAALSPASAQDPAEIVKRSADRNARNFELLKDYTLIQHTEERLYNHSGKLQTSATDTYDISVLGGRPYGRHVAHNDKPLAAGAALREQEKMDRELKKRQQESPVDKARLEKQRAAERRFLNEIPEAFAMKLEGVESVSGKPAWVIALDPKPGYKPRDSRANLLTKVRAKLWIDQAEYQWVKVDADVLDTISYGFALLRIAPGSRLHFEQVRVNGEVWLPSMISVRADARVGYVKRLRGEFDVAYRDYKKFQTDSRIVEIEEQQ